MRICATTTASQCGPAVLLFAGLCPASLPAVPPCTKLANPTGSLVADRYALNRCTGAPTRHPNAPPLPPFPASPPHPTPIPTPQPNPSPHTAHTYTHTHPPTPTCSAFLRMCFSTRFIFTASATSPRCRALLALLLPSSSRVCGRRRGMQGWGAYEKRGQWASLPASQLAAQTVGPQLFTRGCWPAVSFQPLCPACLPAASSPKSARTHR